MDGNKFEHIMANAQRLMLDEEFNRKVESKAASFAGRKSGGVSDVSSLERQAFGSSYEEKPIQMIQVEDNGLDDKRFSKLPAAIRESFSKTPPLTGQDNSVMGRMTSNLSINEQSIEPKRTSTPIGNGSGIDYSLIKAIIDESVRRNLEEMRNGLLNENVIRGMKIAKGNKIQFLDSAGNLYEGVLTLKKKAGKV